MNTNTLVRQSEIAASYAITNGIKLYEGGGVGYVEGGTIHFTGTGQANELLTPHLAEYKTLIEVSLDTLYIIGDGYQRSELTNIKRNDNEIKKWYLKIIDYQYKHERAHYLGVAKIPTLSCQLGVAYYVDNDGELNTYPIVKLSGYANLVQFKKVVVRAPDIISQGDHRFLNLC